MKYAEIVMPFEWIENPKRHFADIYHVVARVKINMPSVIGYSCIDITEKETHGGSICYESTLWCLSRGTKIVGYCEAWTIDEAKEKTFKWWVDFISGFLKNTD